MPVATTRSYSLPKDVAEYIDTLPKRERSKFVASTLRRAVQKQSKLKALTALKAIVPVEDDDPRTSVELIRESRRRRLEQLTSNISEND